jgi:hypothetical protein
VADTRVIANPQNRPIDESRRKRKHALTIDFNMVPEDDIPTSLDKVDERARTQSPPDLFTVGFEQRFTHEDTHTEIIGGSTYHEQPQHRLDHEPGRG